jgi:hypothetical protein
MAKNNLPEAARGTVEREATYEQSVATDQQGESPVMGMRRKAAKEVEEYFDYYKGALTDNFKRITDHWKLYMRSAKDKRKKHEKWRALVAVPYPYSGTETTVAALQELIHSQSPAIMPESIGMGDEPTAQKMERYWDYIQRRMRLTQETDLFFREMVVQGYAIRKNVWVRKERQIMVLESEDQAREFDERMQEAIEVTGQQPPEPEMFGTPADFQRAFEEYRFHVIKEAKIPLPPIPAPGPTKVLHYAGPGMKRTSVYNFFFDPLSQITEQPTIERSIVPMEWVMDRAGKEDNRAFDGEAVQAAMMEAGEERRLDEWQSELADIYGVNSGESESPRYRKAVELLEFYNPADKKMPYRMIMNRKMMINKTPHIPFQHGDHPYTILTNIELPWTSVGMSDLYQPGPLYKEMNTLRGLRLDAVALSVLPVFAKMKEAGLTELARRFSPGLILDTARGPGSIGQVTSVEVPSEAFKEIYEIKDDIDTTNATQPMVRGQTGPTNITATHAERAVQSAATRTTQRVLRIEGELSRFVDQSLSLMHQFMSEDDKIRVGGKDKIDPFLTFQKKDFLHALHMEYAFRSARTTVNKELVVQQMKDLLATYTDLQIPGFKPEVLAKRIQAKLDQDWESSWMTEEELQAQQEAAAAEEQAASDEEAEAQEGGGGGAAQEPPAQA